MNTASIDLSMWMGGAYFMTHPEKVLGTPKVVSGPFGPVTIIDGDIDNIKSIQTIDVTAYPYIESVFTGESESSNQEMMIQAALEKSKLPQDPPVTAELEIVDFNELRQRFSPGSSDDDYVIWTRYQLNRLFDNLTVRKPNNPWSQYIVSDIEFMSRVPSWVSSGAIAFDGNEFIPGPIYYAGDIYEKLRDIKLYKKNIVDQIGEDGYSKQLELLTQATPEKLRLMAPADERLHISALDPFSRNNYVNALSDGTILEPNTDMVRAFIIWLGTQSPAVYTNGSTEHDVIRLFIEGKSVPGKDISEEVKIERKRKAQLDGYALFSKFTYEGISRDDQQAIEHVWNARFNSWREFDYNKIPVGFEINKWFKSGPIDPRPALWEGVKFMGANGSGIIAFDVGVGKTMTAILAMAQALFVGQCKRPLIVVPNPTYDKWIGETIGEWNGDGTCRVHGVLPQYRDRVNSYYNLGAENYQYLLENPPRDYTISFMTYEGFMQMGMSRKVINEMGNEFVRILNQGELSERDEAKLIEKVDEILGSVTSGTNVNFDELGFDYVIIDEAHNFKKIFTAVKARTTNDQSDEGEREMEGRNPYALSSGSPSVRGLKAFVFCNYIQRRHLGANTVLLTATPFTNSPLEIFSMLALVAHATMEKRQMFNLIDFFDKFIEQSNEWVINSKGTWELRNVVKSFHNKVVLQSLIYGSVIYKTGEEAQVPRPIKVVYPLVRDTNGVMLPLEKQVKTQLPPNDLQTYWLKEIYRFANEEPNEIEPRLSGDYWKPNPWNPDGDYVLLGRVTMAITMAQMCTLSPLLVQIKGKSGAVEKLVDQPDQLTPEYFVNSAPKIKYTIDCIRTIREWHISRGEEVSGVVIYCARGTEQFPLIKQHIVNTCGYKPSEIQIISGGITQEKKERIKVDFLEGRVKIIIGSGTIKEGIDLQTRSTCLFNLYLDWNPTDITQINGRIWRQGNIHSHVRLVTPLIENSMDIFLFQKLEEKTSRINDLWYRNGRSNVLNVEEFDPNELKNGLITDPSQRAQQEINMELDRIKNEISVFNQQIDLLNGAQSKFQLFKSKLSEIDEYYKRAKDYLVNRVNQNKSELANSGEDLSESKKAAIQSQIESLEALLAREVEENTKYAVIKRYSRYRLQESISMQFGMSNMITIVDNQIRLQHELDQVQKNILAPVGLRLGDNVESLIESFNAQIKTLTDRKNELYTDQYKSQLTDKYADEQRRLMQESRPIEVRVDEFTRHNYLLSCLKDIHECSLDSAVAVVRGNKDIKELGITDWKAKAVESINDAGSKQGFIDQLIDETTKYKQLPSVIGKNSSVIADELGEEVVFSRPSEAKAKKYGNALFNALIKLNLISADLDIPDDKPRRKKSSGSGASSSKNTDEQLRIALAEAELLELEMMMFD